MKFIKIIFCFCFTIFFITANAQTQLQPAFKAVPLGVEGGIDEGNLSSYMIAPEGSNGFVCLDAGTIREGIEKAISNEVFKTSSTKVLKNYIKGYLISHGHLDHVAGLIINSPDDTTKNIYGMNYTIDVLRDKYFTWESWANFSDEGEKPALNKYHYTGLTAAKEISLVNTSMFVTAFELSHGNPYKSTAFLIRHAEDYVLYLGDTGADSLEKSDDLKILWERISPLILQQKLKAIFIEVSFPDEQPFNQLFGHLTPTLLMNEMQKLAKFCSEKSLQNVSVVITHEKPPKENEAKIKHELSKLNSLHLNIIYPQQGEMLQF